MLWFHFCISAPQLLFFYFCTSCIAFSDTKKAWTKPTVTDRHLCFRFGATFCRVALGVAAALPCRDALGFVSITGIVVACLFAFVYISYKLCFCSPHFFVFLLFLYVAEGFHFHINMHSHMCMHICTTHLYMWSKVGFGSALQMRA